MNGALHCLTRRPPGVIPLTWHVRTPIPMPMLRCHVSYLQLIHKPAMFIGRVWPKRHA